MKIYFSLQNKQRRVQERATTTTHLRVEGRHQAGGVIIHQLDQHGQHVPEVPVLLDRGQVVQDALQLVLLHPGPDHDELLDKVEDVGPDGDDVRLAGPGDVEPLGRNAGVLAGAGLDDPVVGLEGVHGLQHSGHPPHVAVDLRVGQELGRQVVVQTDLHRGRGVDPETGIKQTVIQQLLEQQVTVGRGAGDQVLGQLEEGVEQVRGQVLPARAGQKVGDDEEPASSDDLLLDAGAPHDQLADELHQARAEARVLAAAVGHSYSGAVAGSCCCCCVATVVLSHGVVQLGEEWKEDLDPTDRVQSRVNRSRDDRGHVLECGGMTDNKKVRGSF